MKHFAFLLILLLTGCGTARTMVVEPVGTNQKYRQVQLMNDKQVIEVPKEVLSQFEKVVSKGLYDDGLFSQGQELKIKYTFVLHEKGDRFQRWFFGGIVNSGEGSVVVVVRYYDAQDTLIAQNQVEGRIGSGFFGGDFRDAIERAGEDVVEFTVKNFAQGKDRKDEDPTP